MATPRVRDETDLPRLFTDADRWQAVVRRDARADGRFYYSVRTTGVYCRPACAARLARRENVGFHASCAEAEQAGFRPCKRCRPNEPALAASAPRRWRRPAASSRHAEELPQPRSPRRGRRHEPLSLSPRLQGGDRRDAARLTPSPIGPQRVRDGAAARRHGDRGDL